LLFIPQYKVESYISLQKQMYGILKDRNRLKIKPFSIFFIERVFFKNHYYTMSQYMYPYYENKIDLVVSIELYDTYILYSYYNLDEIVLTNSNQK